jgi:uncharacterized DUF497 family protein
MIFEWDEKKDKTNQAKHHLSFKDASNVFSDPFSVTRWDNTDKESRRQIIGHLEGMLVILVVFTIRGESDEEEVVRIISARKATTSERRSYEAGTWF